MKPHKDSGGPLTIWRGSTEVSIEWAADTGQQQVVDLSMCTAEERKAMMTHVPARANSSWVLLGRMPADPNKVEHGGSASTVNVTTPGLGVERPF
eukprot:6187718-Pleurochrysis_carterae.AAC.1